jgi:hypothetical protein
VRNGLIKTRVSCGQARKVAPAFNHLLKEANCGGLTICGDDKKKLVVAFTCPSGKSLRALKRSLEREVQLYRHHHLAGKKRRR